MGEPLTSFEALKEAELDEKLGERVSQRSLSCQPGERAQCTRQDHGSVLLQMYYHTTCPCFDSVVRYTRSSPVKCSVLGTAESKRPASPPRSAAIAEQII